MADSSDQGPTRRRTGGLGWNLGSAALPIVGSFLVSVLLAPHLGDEGWGRYSLVLSAATLWLIVGKFGVHAATSRLVTENEAEPGPWIRSGLLLRSLFTLGVALLALLTTRPLAASFGRPDEAGTFLLVAPVIVGASLYEFASEILVGLRRFTALLVARFSYLALRMAVVALVLLADLGVRSFLTGHALSQLLPAGVLLALLLLRNPASQVPLGPSLRRTFDLSLPLAFGSASFLVFSHTDRLMLGWFQDEATVGQFAVARNVLDATLFPMTALSWSLRPALVRAASRGGDAFTAEMAGGWRLALFFSLAAPMLLGLLGPVLLVDLYTDTYTEASRLLVWMLPVLLLRGLGTLVFPALLALDRQTIYARLMAWTAVANVAANLILIPALGARGAILATLLSLMILTAGGFEQVRRRTGTLGLLRERGGLLRGTVAVLAVGLVLWLARGELHGLTGRLIAGGVAAALVTWAGLGPSVLGRWRRRR